MRDHIGEKLYLGEVLHPREPRISLRACFAAAILLLLYTDPAHAQIDEARQAIDRGEYVRAVNILSAAMGDQPSADTYLYLGIAYRRMREYQKAEDIFREGNKRYPDDTRFPIELANQFLENNDIDAAKSELRRTLDIDPGNSYASDQLATIDMSEGNVQAALRSWNKSDRPFINDILHNYYLNFGSWVVRRGITFNPSGTLRYDEWKTTEARLLATDNFSNVGLDLEPTTVPDQYNAVIRTTIKTNTPADFLFNAVKNTYFKTSYVDIWNIRNSGVNFNGNYRYDANRRRIEGLFNIPMPIGGLMQVELGDIWRAERWNVSTNIQPDLLPEAQFLYKANALRIRVKQIPQYRVELGAGFEYRNRAAQGDLPQLFTDNLNTGLFLGEVNLWLLDGDYKNRLHLEAFGATPRIIGNTKFIGGMAELSNRITLSRDTQTSFDWALKGGTERGDLPFEDYFLLGVDIRTPNRGFPNRALLLRGHQAAHNGQYGFGPMGTDFVLLNTEIQRRLKTIPFFNMLNIPYLNVKGNVFVDMAKTWDRNDIFEPSKFLIDTGAGLRLETPTHSLNLGYGRSLRDGRNVLFMYYERRIW